MDNKEKQELDLRNLLDRLTEIHNEKTCKTVPMIIMVDEADKLMFEALTTTVKVPQENTDKLFKGFFHDLVLDMVKIAIPFTLIASLGIPTKVKEDRDAKEN